MNRDKNKPCPGRKCHLQKKALWWQTVLIKLQETTDTKKCHMYFSDLDYLYQPAVYYSDLLASMFACDTPQKPVLLSLQ